MAIVVIRQQHGMSSADHHVEPTVDVEVGCDRIALEVADVDNFRGTKHACRVRFEVIDRGGSVVSNDDFAAAVSQRDIASWEARYTAQMDPPPRTTAASVTQAASGGWFGYPSCHSRPRYAISTTSSGALGSARSLARVHTTTWAAARSQKYRAACSERNRGTRAAGG